MAHLDATSVVTDGRQEPNDRLRHLAESVAEPRVLQPEPEPDRLARRDRLVVRRLDLVEAGLGPAGTVVHDLARTPLVARLDHVALADLPAGDADLLGEPVEHTLHRELRLVRTEPAERAAHEVVRSDGDRLDVDRRPSVRPARMPGRPLEHLHPDARIRARVADAANLEGGHRAVGVAARPVLEFDRVPLGVHPEALLARQRALDGTPELPGGERCLRLVAHVLLATERASVGDQLDRDPRRIHIEHRRDVVAVVPHTLATGVDVQRSVAAVTGRDGDGRLGFEEGVLDPLGLERLVHGECARGEGRLEVRTPGVGAGRQHVRVGAPHRQWCVVVECGAGVGVGGVDVVGDLDQLGGGAGVVTGVGDDDGEHVARIRRAAADGDHHRPVLVDDPDAQLARQVISGEHRLDAGCCERRRCIDRHDVGAGVTRSDGARRGASRAPGCRRRTRDRQA